MTGNLRWHSCSTDDFPLKRHKVSKACETCRAKKMRCDGKNPCQRCESNKIKCIYNDKPVRSRSRIPTTTTTTKSSAKNLRISTNTSSIADTSSPSPSTVTSLPSPMPEVKINSDCLKKITFVNELYETLRLQQSPKTRRYGTSMPPLLLDFFNTTSQPQTIWTCFSLCLHRFCDSSNNNNHFMRDAPENESNELVKETFRVFVTHNLLYGAFIDTELLLFVLDSVSMFSYMQQSSSSPTAVTTDDLMANMTTTTKQDTSSTSLPYYSIVIYCILAITFQSAYQSLPNMNENFTNSLYIYSHIFYREAHKRFLSICFSTIPAHPVTTTKTTTTKEKDDGDDENEKRRNIIMLVQASVLLTHFQCTAISEEQAYMTIKIGLNLVQQHALTTLYDDNEAQEDDDKESLFVLLKSLDAWYVWLAFYLQKPYSTMELDISHISSTQLQGQQHLFLKKNKDQKWAIHITDAFTCFLKNILKSKQTQVPMSIYTVKESLKYLNNSITNHDNDEDFIPSHIISLYHDILTIQLYTCQLDDHFSLLHNNSDDHTSEDNNNIHEHTAVEVCILASQNILTTVNKVIFVEYNNTNATAPLKYIPLSIIYSVCLISQINLYLTSYNKKKLASFVKEIEYLQSSLDKMLKIASPYFEAFQIIYSKFNSGNVPQQKLVSPSPSSLSTSSSTTTATTTQTVTNHHAAANHSKTTVNNTPIPSEAQHYLSHASNSNDMFMTDSQHFAASMSLPLTTGVIRSRADIDREQLDKLSHNKSSAHHHHHQLQQQQQLLQQQFLLQKQQQQQLNQFQFQQQQQAPPNSNFYLQKYMQQQPTTNKRNMNGYHSQQQLNEQQMYYCGKQQKRSYQQQLYEQFGYMTPQHQPQQQQIKRHRSSTATSFDEFTAAAAAAAAAGGHHKSNPMVVDEEGHTNQHHERSKSVTTTATTGFIDLESNNDPTFMYNMWMLEGAAAAATQGEELYDARHQRHQSNTTQHALNPAYLQQQQQQQQQQQDNGLTKLPLPQPSKQASMVTKWSAPAPTQTWSKFFFESEVQTLHFQTPPLIHFETNNTFPMVGLNVIQEEGVGDTQSSQQQQPNGTTNTNSETFMYPTHHHHRASIISDHSSASSSICSTAGGGANIITPTTAAAAVTAVAATSSQGSNEEIEAEAAAAAAAAAAVWASTAAAVAANNAAFTTNNKQQPSGTPTPTATSTTGHWINSEKVGDEEFWGE